MTNWCPKPVDMALAPSETLNTQQQQGPALFGDPRGIKNGWVWCKTSENSITPAHANLICAGQHIWNQLCLIKSSSACTLETTLPSLAFHVKSHCVHVNDLLICYAVLTFLWQTHVTRDCDWNFVGVLSTFPVQLMPSKDIWVLSPLWNLEWEEENQLE